MIAEIESTIIKLDVTWDEVVGLEKVKKIVQESVSRPLRRPDLYKGIRTAAKGILLYGPPGTGKTMIGKCAASAVDATFFYVTPSTLGSKWFGESEKLVMTLFEVAKQKQPSVIFIDEVDALTNARSTGEQETTRRVKTEIFTQMDGARTSKDDQIIVIGATNRPQDMDSAALRRFSRHVFVPLPDAKARETMIKCLLCNAPDIRCVLTAKDIKDLVTSTDFYSGADVTNVCKEAALIPLREIENIDDINEEEIRAVTKQDILKAIHDIKASVGLDELQALENWRPGMEK